MPSEFSGAAEYNDRKVSNPPRPDYDSGEEDDDDWDVPDEYIFETVEGSINLENYRYPSAKPPSNQVPRPHGLTDEEFTQLVSEIGGDANVHLVFQGVWNVLSDFTWPQYCARHERSIKQLTLAGMSAPHEISSSIRLLLFSK